MAAAISVLYLWRDRAERKGKVTGLVASLPDASRLDTLSYRILAFAFPLWTFAVVAGAIWQLAPEYPFAHAHTPPVVQ